MSVILIGEFPVYSSGQALAYKSRTCIQTLAELLKLSLLTQVNRASVLHDGVLKQYDLHIILQGIA